MQDQLLALVAGVVDELNEGMAEKIPTDDLPAVALYGEAGVFNSMHLVNFLSLVEEALEDTYDVSVSLTSEKAVSQRVSPFSSVRRLVRFIEEELRLAGVADEAGDAGGAQGTAQPAPA